MRRMEAAADKDVGRASGELLAASFAALFLELALIRWLPMRVRVAAYFPNLTLLAAFLGLGVGALRARARSLLWLWPGAVLVLVLAAWAMSRIAFTANGVTEHLWLLYADLGDDAPVVDGIRLPLVVIFVLVAICFVPLGQVIGARLEHLRVQRMALRGYAIDLGGSLLGVIGFTVISGNGLPPVVWFAPALAAGLVFVSPSNRQRIAYGVAVIAILSVAQRTTGFTLFSPYYALQTIPSGVDASVTIRANGSAHQEAMDLVTERGDRKRLLTMLGYRLPYVRLGRPIQKALVLGAGSGNDVAALIQQGAQEIHAVEIDPVILAIGRAMHPNSPYADPRVIVHNTDARSFLNETHDRFDVIVFGTLDSMTRLSALSNVRLDNFVYTREAIEAARDRLTPDGGLILYFMIGQQYIADHLVSLLTETFGAPPQVQIGDYSLFNSIFMAGPAFAVSAPSPRLVVPTPKDLPTDDWPYLYLSARGLNAFYLSMMAIIAALAVAAVAVASPEMRTSVRTRRGMDVEMFLFGFAFLLVETKFVTAMNLLWGATWITSAVVFGAILGVILLGTLATDRWPLPFMISGALLVAALVATWAVPPRLLLSTSPPIRLLLSVLYVGTPVLFASICFAERFEQRAAADLAFGWNLIGAVLGGLTEFFSMAAGFRALTLVAICAYLGVLVLANGRLHALDGTGVEAVPG